MQIVVFSLKRDPRVNHYNEIKYDEGEGWKYYANMVEVEGEWFDEIIASPIGFINSFMQKHNGTLLQLVEVNGFEHLRFYVQVPADYAGLELTPHPPATP